MEIGSSLQAVYQSFKDYASQSKLATMSIILELKKMRDNTDVFQKICQVAFAIFQLHAIRYVGNTSFARLAGVLYASSTIQDFLNLIKYPRLWFCPIHAEAIDENAVLLSLKEILLKKIQIIPQGQSNVVFPQNFSEEMMKQVEEVAKECLHDLLNGMVNHNVSYRDAGEFRKVLEERLNGETYKKSLSKANLHLEFVSLAELNVALRQNSLLHYLSIGTWFVVDAMCVAVCLKEWKLLDTAKWAAGIGQYSGFQWIGQTKMDSWFIGGIATAFALKMMEAIRKLCVDPLSRQEQGQARRNVITSLAEFVLFGTMYLNSIALTHISFAALQYLAIIAKSIGILSIITQRKREFFQQPVPESVG